MFERATETSFVLKLEWFGQKILENSVDPGLQLFLLVIRRFWDFLGSQHYSKQSMHSIKENVNLYLKK